MRVLGAIGYLKKKKTLVLDSRKCINHVCDGLVWTCTGLCQIG